MPARMEPRMSRLLSCLVYIVLSMTLFVVSAYATPLRNFRLDAEFTPQQAQELGISPHAKTFSPYDVKTAFLIIEIFSMYCPHCQRQAPIMNEFEKMLQQSPHANQFSTVGIGVGNSAFEVGIFRDEYKIDFPLVPDEDFIAHAATGEHGTPHFFLLDMRNGKNRGEILYEHAGVFVDPKTFLQEIFSNAGLKQ